MHDGSSQLGGLPQGLGRTPAHRGIARSLREAILSGRLPGGTHLVQAELAAELGTSNTPVREAIRELATEGLVRLDPYRGAVVHAPTLPEIRESYEIALLLEPAAVRKAAENDGGRDVGDLHALMAEMQGVASALEYAELNRRLHRAIHSHCGAPQIAEILGGLHDRTALHTAVCLDRGMRSPGESNGEHAEIVAAIEAGDGSRAEELMRDHLRGTYDALSALIAAPPVAEG